LSKNKKGKYSAPGNYFDLVMGTVAAIIAAKAPPGEHGYLPKSDQSLLIPRTSPAGEGVGLLYNKIM
jgi:hypothetical protein